MKTLMIIMAVATIGQISNAKDIVTKYGLHSSDLIKVEIPAPGYITLKHCLTHDVTKCDPEVIGTYTAEQVEHATQQMLQDNTLLSYLRRLALHAGGYAAGGAGIGWFFGGIGAGPGAVVGGIVGIYRGNTNVVGHIEKLYAIRGGLRENSIEVFTGSTKDLIKLLNQYLPVNPKFLE